MLRCSSLLISVALLAAAAACGKNAPDEDEVKAPEVPTISAAVATIARQPIARTLIVRGTVTATPNQDVKISALVPGRVVSMRVAEGDAVRRGQVVAEIDPGPLEDQRRQARAVVEQAKAALENAKSNLERTERLVDRGIAARKEAEDARAQMAAAQAGLDQANAALDTANRNVARSRVAAPIDGQVVKRLVSVGEQVDGTGAQPLLEVANLASVELAANIPAEYLGVVRVGQRAEIIAETFPDRTFDGRVIAIAPAVDPESNSALARVLVRNPGLVLKVGMFAQVRIPAEEHANALVVPPSAITREQGNAFIYVLKGGEAQRTPVVTGIETPDAVEITSGASEGQQVLTSSVHGLGERARIRQGRGR